MLRELNLTEVVCKILIVKGGGGGTNLKSFCPFKKDQICIHRVRTSHGKPGKSWNLRKMKVLFHRSVTADGQCKIR